MQESGKVVIHRIKKHHEIILGAFLVLAQNNCRQTFTSNLTMSVIHTQETEEEDSNTADSGDEDDLGLDDATISGQVQMCTRTKKLTPNAICNTQI